jgi:hypothetical protein
VSTNRPAPTQPSSARQRLQGRSALPLVYLRHLPAWLPPTVLAALLVAGLAVKGWPGTVALCVVAAFLGWLAFLSWPALTARGRLGRVLTIAGLLVVAALQATR